MRKAHTYSKSALDAAQLLGLAIARGRRARQWKAEELAERAGISRNTLYAAERGAPTVGIGLMFELAVLVGIDLFGAGPEQLSDMVARSRERLALLPASVHDRRRELPNDF